MRVAVTGSSGLIGRALTAGLRAEGHTVSRVVRRESPNDSGAEIVWDPSNGRIDRAALEGHDAVVHLAGESLIGLWTGEKKRRIRDSRIKGTALLASALAELDRKPRVLLSGSAMGFYGDRGDEPLDEMAGAGHGFLAETAVEWEAAAAAASTAGIQVAFSRTGLVLDPHGGALGAMLPIFRWGLGGRLGDGRQMWSWITLRDQVAGMIHVLLSDVRGPVNFAAPNPVTNQQFTDALARVLSRPAVLAVPAFALKVVNREMAQDMLLSSQRMVPRVLLGSGFKFRDVEIEQALHAMLKVRG